MRRAIRLRADGSPIEVVSAFYAPTRMAFGWKFFALSDITVPTSHVSGRWVISQAVDMSSGS
jgi:hypothetical protein